MNEIPEEDGQFDRLLKEFSLLGPLRNLPKTFLGISGFAHLEIPCSNILAFFLNPIEEHGLGNVFLNSLLSVYDSKYNSDFAVKQFKFDRLIREEPTEARKRIDLMIIAPPLLVGIENKMHTGAEDNPFGDYTKHLQEVAGQKGISSKNIIRILLSLNPECERDGFKPISYDELFDRLSKRLPKNAPVGDQRFRTFLDDFVKTIQNQKGKIQMDNKLCALLQKHEAQATTVQFYARLKSFDQFLRSKVREVAEMIPVPVGFEGPLYWGSLANGKGDAVEVYDSIMFDRSTSKGPITVQVSVGPRGWEVGLWFKDGKNAEWLKRQGIQGCKFPFENAPEKEVAEACQRLLARVRALS